MSPEANISKFLSGFTAETTPGSAAKIPDFREHLREGTVVYITFLPGSDFNDTVSVAKRLRGEGFIPVPHFAARSIPDKATLDNYLSMVVGEAGVVRPDRDPQSARPSVSLSASLIAADEIAP